ncbi:MAG: amidohydrolase [Sphingomonas sp.]
MWKSLIALGAALCASPAFSITLIDHANGIQTDAAGRITHFTGLVVGDDGKIVRVLRAGDRRPTAAHRIDVQGGTLLPGLIDAHGHVMDLGMKLTLLDVTGVRSLGELKQRLSAYAAAHPEARWIVGRGWNQELWAEKRFPAARDLDAVVGDRPVWLVRVDEHAAVANSAAMRAAGITAETRDPAGGKIERDASGSPAGLFVDNARELVESKIPAPSIEQQDRAFDATQQLLLSFGVTATDDMATTANAWNVFRRAADAGRLKVRLVSFAYGRDNLAKIAPNGPTPWLYNDHLRSVGLKLFADGALGSRGAWMKQPYADAPDTRGIPRITPDALLRDADWAAARHFQVAVHAIGDAANAMVISAYQALAKKYGRDRRWRIEHAQIIDPADIPRMAPAGIIASMQPTHETSDRLMAEARLGPNRLQGAYAWRTIARSGVPLAFGSDYPVESPNPFPGLSAAISRQDVNGQPPGGWIPSERLSLAQALSAFTRGAAYASFSEDRYGSLEPGKWADFILVDRDPTKVDPPALARTRVLETWIGGKKMWSSPSPAPPAK